MKRVSFSVAKALKEAGYPQGETDDVYSLENYSCYIVGGLYSDYAIDFVKTCDAPFAMEVWLWLWREKDIRIKYDLGFSISGVVQYQSKKWYTDPEEAIIEAIEHLVKNDLIN